MSSFAKYYTLKMFLWDAISGIVMALIMVWFAYHENRTGPVNLFTPLMTPVMSTIFSRWGYYYVYKKELKKAAEFPY